METNTPVRILNIMAGAQDGGAESFFERFCIAIEKKKNFKQKVLIKNNTKRFNFLKKSINNLEQLFFFNFFNPFFHTKIKSIFLGFKPDIVVSWMNRASAVLPRTKYFSEQKIGRLGGYYNLKYYLQCDYLIANTLDIKKYICRNGWDPKKVVYIPNFVNTNNQSKVKLPIEKKGKVILCLGRFHPNKGIDILIQAMIYLPDYYLWIIGNGVLKDSYIELAKKLELSHRVEYFDWTKNISKYLNIASVLVCPSRHEPFGNIIVDGWAHRVPVIASDIGGPSILIQNHFNGLKFKNGDFKECAKLIKKILNDEKLKNKIVKNGFIEFRKKFSEEIIINKYLEFFKMIMKKCAV